MGFSRKRKCNPPVEDINGKFQGGTPKIEEKNPGGQIQKIDILNRMGGVYNFILEKPNIYPGYHLQF